MAEQLTREAADTSPASTPNKPKPKSGSAGKRKKKILKTVISLLVIAGILGGGGFALYRFLNDGGNAQLGEIYAEPAQLGSIQSSASGSGSARAKESAAITLAAGGTVKEVFVTSGDIVYEGQPLYSIDSQAALDAVDEALAAETTARETVARLQEDLANLYESMNDLVTTAPFSGKLMDVGSFAIDDQVGAGTPVATLVNDRTLKLSLYFSYAYENDIYVGQPVTVTIPAVMGAFEGKVDEIHKVNYITPEGAVFFEVVVSFANPGTLTAGMEASAAMTASDGTDIYPYYDEDNTPKTAFYETRTITAKVGGPVVAVGSRLLNHANVSAGDVLLRLGDTDISDRIRAKQDEIATAQAAAEQAQEKVLEARQALDNFNAVAPIDGTVITCTLNEGAEVKSGDTVIIISNTTTMLVSITVDDRNISFLHPGDTVDLTWNGMPYQGTVTAIDMGGAQQGSGMTRYPVTLTVDNYDGSLMDGAWLQYSFVTSQSDQCVTVPSGAIRYFSDTDGNRQTVVFVRRDTRPDDVPELDLPTFDSSMGQERTFPSEEEGYYPVIVETGLSNTQSTEIISGVETGDMVFVNYVVTNSAWG